MKVKRTNLTDELMGFQEIQAPSSRKAYPPIIIQYDQVIQRQAQIIETLYRQCTALRQKVIRLKSSELFSSQPKSPPQNNMQTFAEIIQNSLLKQIGTLLEIQEKQISKNKVIHTIKRLKWERQKKSQPIFIESIKQVRIPVPIQIFVEKPVEKIVFKEKIIIQQKIVEVPVFKQKIVQRFVSKIQQNDPLPSTISKLSSQGFKKQNSSGLEKADDSLFLGTQSMLKQQSKQKPVKQQSRKNSSHFQQKPQIYRPEKKNYQNYGINKKLVLSDIRSDEPNMNRTQMYQNNPSNRSQFNSRGSKQNIQSPKYRKNDYRDNYRQYEYTQEDYSYQGPNQYQEGGERNSKTFYGNSKEHNRTVISPKNNYQQKYRDQTDRYAFDKNKFLDQSKLNPSNKNIKRREKYDFYDKYKDR